MSALLICAFLPASLTAAQGKSRQAEASEDFRSAVAHYNSGQYTEAARELESLARGFPASFEIEELLGLVYSAEAKDSVANLHLETAVRLRPGSALARANLAINLARLGQNDRAETEFKKALQIEPASFATNHDLGEFYVKTEKISAAIPYLKKAQSVDPSSYANGYDLALSYFETNNVSSAREQIRELLGQQDTAELHNLLGEVEEKASDFVAAASEFQRAAQMDPSEPNIFDWGSELLIHRTLDPAIEVFFQGQAHYPNSSRVAVGLGLALYLRGRYDEAVKALLHATDLSPADSRAYYFLSEAYDSSPTQADAVIQRFRRYMELERGNARATFYYAMALWKGTESESSGVDLERVSSLLKKALALDPSLTEAHLQLGNLYSNQKKYNEAVGEYHQALDVDPSLEDAHYRLGQAYRHLGKTELALREFQTHQQIQQEHLAESDKRQEEVQEFVYSVKGVPVKP